MKKRCAGSGGDEGAHALDAVRVGGSVVALQHATIGSIYDEHDRRVGDAVGAREAGLLQHVDLAVGDAGGVKLCAPLLAGVAVRAGDRHDRGLAVAGVEARFHVAGDGTLTGIDLWTEPDADPCELRFGRTPEGRDVIDARLGTEPFETFTVLPGPPAEAKP